MLSVAPSALDELFTTPVDAPLNLGAISTPAIADWEADASYAVQNSFSTSITGGEEVVSGGSFAVGSPHDGMQQVLVSGAGSTWRIGQWIEIGDRTAGRVIVEDGGLWVANNWAAIGTRPSGDGEVIVRGEGSRWDLANYLTVGHDGGGWGVGGHGRLLIEDGGVVDIGDRAEIGSVGMGEVFVRGADSELNVGMRLEIATSAPASVYVTDGGVVAADSINVRPAGRLLGDGTIRGQITNEGQIGPDAAHGIMLVEGSLTLQPASNLGFVVAGTSRGQSYGGLDVLGPLNYGGKLTVKFTSGFAPQAGDEFELIRGNAGAFASIEIVGLAPGFQYSMLHSGGGLKLRANNNGVAIPTTPAAGVLANDVDADGDALSVRLFEQPTNGTLTLYENGSFRYQPHAGFHGYDSFQYRVFDGAHVSEPTTAYVQVGAPSAFANDDAYQVEEAGSIVIPATTGVMANDDTPFAAALSAVRIVAAVHGNVVLNPDGSFTYTAPANFSGVDMFQYRLSDGGSLSNIATVSITVSQLNDAPIAIGELYHTSEDTPLVVTASSPGQRIFQSTNNPQFGGFGGSSISSDQFLGARFQVTSPTTTGRVGGLLGGTGTAFAAIVALSSPDDLPNSFDLSTPDVLAHTLLTLPGGSGVIVTSPLEVPLSPGWYAIVIGTGEFGSDGSGYMPDSGSGEYEVFHKSKLWTDGSWRWNSQPERRNHFLVDSIGMPAHLLANDSDEEHSPLTAVLDAAPQHGTVSIAPSGAFTYAPSAGFVGTDAFTYRASDGESSSAPATVSIVVRSGITPLATADSFDALEGATLTVDAGGGLLANDAGLNASAKLLINPTRGTLTLAVDGSFTYAPNEGFAGVDYFWYRLETGDSFSAPAVVTINVANVIDAPIAHDDVYHFEKDTLLSAGVGQIAANRLYLAAAQKLQTANLDGSDLHTVLVPSTSPDAVAVDVTNGWFYWALGPADFKIYRSRLDGSQVQALVTIAPAPGGGQNPTPNVMDIALDVAGGKMYWATNGPNGTAGKIWRANLDGSSPTQLVTTSYMPAALELDLLHGKMYWTNRHQGSIQRADLNGTGIETMVSGLTSPNALTLDVANGTMYWFAGEYYQENRLMRSRLDGEDVETLATFAHSDPTDLAFEPIKGRLYWTDGTGAIWSANRNGTSATRIIDGGVSGAGGIALDQAFAVGYANNLLANDAFELPEGGEVSVTLVSGASHGALVLNSDGTFTYDSNLGFQGTDSFTYQITAGELVSDIATVHLAVIRTNDVPAVAVADSYLVVEDTPLLVSGASGVLANDTDIEGDLLVAHIVNSTAHGTLVLSESGSFTYSPDLNFTGADSFSYRVWDGYKFSNHATVTINVTTVADPPTAVADHFYAAAGVVLRMSTAADGVLANDFDGDQDTISAVLLSAPQNGSLTLNANGTFAYTPNVDFIGSDYFTYRAVDAAFTSASARVDLDILAPREVSGYVWHDANANGRQEAGELAASGVLIHLLDSDKTVLSSATTDTAGRYMLAGLAVGHDYSVEIIAPEGSLFTRKDAGSDDGTDSDVIRGTGRSEVIRLALHEFDRSVDAGLVSSSLAADVYDHLRISELLFIGHGHAEFIELTNIGAAPVDLSGVRFTDGVYFDFAESDVQVLLPGEFIVIVGDESLFHQNYPSSDIVIAGQFTGRLNQEERLVMVGPSDDPILDFTYDDDWFAVTDNEFSPFAISALDLSADPAAWNSRTNWRPGSLVGGSPGDDDPGLTPDPGTVVISEFLANPLAGERDWIEIHNTTDQPIDIGYWWLGDGRGYGTMRYQIPAETIIEAGAYLMFRRDESFTFGLDADGDSVYLTAGNAEGRPMGYSEMAEDYVATESGVSLGRIVTTGGGSDYTALTAPTPGGPNAMPKIGPLVINEVMYRPAEFRDEFIEIYNTTTQPISLDSWSLGAILIDPHGSDDPMELFDFPDGVTIPASGYALVVSIDPETFRNQYGIAASVPIVAPFAGPLSDETQTLRLIRTDESADTFVVDQVQYFGSGLWPAGASMGGRSLERIAPPEYGNEPTHWQASMAIGGTPGASNTTVSPLPPGDFNGDFTINSRDIDLISAYLSNPAFTQPLPTTPTAPGTISPATMFDVTSDGAFTAADVTHLITTILQTSFGDVDLNGRVGLADLMVVQRHLGQSTGLGWSAGDFNGDGRVDREDIARLLANFGDASGMPQAPSAAITVSTADRVPSASAVVTGAVASRTRLAAEPVDRIYEARVTRTSQREPAIARSRAESLVVTDRGGIDSENTSIRALRVRRAR